MSDNIFNRISPIPNKTFFFLGPRGSGKSTWLLDNFPKAYRIDLLRSSEFLRLKTDPSLLRNEILALPKNSWVIIDEIQKLPILLDEVHALIFDTKESYQFALSGSSARKLKKSHANLLAGRALAKKFFPLSFLELKQSFNLKVALSFGLLPHIWQLESDIERIEFLDAYVDTYLKEEIQQEALVRGLDTFFKFLRVAAICNGQVLNISNIARDVGVARSTVQGYFEILNDTLIAWQLPAFRPRAKVKEIAHPKFYFFDCGVIGALRNETRKDLPTQSLGHLFETYFINELRAINSYLSLGWQMSYWQAQHGIEVDLIIETPKERIGCEIKYNNIWKKEFNNGLLTLLEEEVIDKAFGIYIGDRNLAYDRITVLPYKEALSMLTKQIKT